MSENQKSSTQTDDAEGRRDQRLVSYLFRRLLFRLGFVLVTRKQLSEWRHAADESEMETIKINPLDPVDQAALTARYLAIREIIEDVYKRAFLS